MLSVGKTHIGKIRKSNEDYHYIDGQGLHVLADGMGGHSAGDIASMGATEYIRKHFFITDDQRDISAYIANIVQDANQTIYNMAQNSEQYQGMGTTLIVAYVDNNNTLYYAHVGDSRLYLHRQNHLIQLTKDHSLVEELLEKGEITSVEAEKHPQKNIITRAIGTSEQVKVDTGQEQLEEGDIFLICTDGLSNMISDDKLQDLINKENNLHKLADLLISEANIQGGADNITVVLGKI